MFAHAWSYTSGHTIGGSCAVGMVGVGGPVLALGRRDAHRSGLLRDTFRSMIFDTCAQIKF